ncbi:1-(5-phosphoribosyl)-5-[(5-phosphoribosylamino)methylideneamino]imidazole-4-carboxamide isomerase [Rickettsiales bacterium]|nr:1-(5-phosphoribosyl)-5-[(5-phosphoribosylamino)methylideneamino]imidazole-4-carboxamide isomerase [Rickettsiales bacterium]
MIFFPAIDIKDSKCIRLEKGKLKNIKFYNENPVAQAIEFQDMGCEWIHVVDIDGAFSGMPMNQDVIYDIKKNTNCKIQVGGGIRDMDTIETYLSNSIDRIILGTIAAKRPSIVEESCKNFPNKIVVGIDSKKDMVATEGWSKTSSLSTIELAKKLEGLGVSSIIFTDIEKDGLLKGMSFKKIKDLLNATTINVIASGGVSSIDDLRNLNKIKAKNLEGVISGKAIYESKFLVSDALKVLMEKT